MKKIIKQKPQEEQSINILKKVAKRVEEATIDISNMKSDLKMVSLRLSGVEHNTGIMKIDMEGLKGEMKEMEVRLGKRISHVADLIAISMDQKFRTVQKRIQKIEHIQQAA